MTRQLTRELRQALSEHPGQPVHVEDPVTHARYVLVPLDVYERLRHALDYDAGEPNPREFYPLFAKAVSDDLDAPDVNFYPESDP